MRRDSIFYRLFQQSPALLFDLINNPPPNATSYRFDSVAVKEPKFEIDGVFLPPEDPGIVYFCEVQFQKDELLYERLFSESFLYLYRNRRRFTDWRAIVIYPSRRTEQSDTTLYRHLLNSPQVQRIYLDELGDIDQQPLGTALMLLTTIDEGAAPEKARSLLARVPQETPDPARQQAIIEMVATIIVYKFTHLSRSEVDAMLGLSLQQTRVYQEAKDEGRQEGEQIGESRGRQEERRSLINLLLTQKFEALPQSIAEAIALLSLDQLESLAIALLNFTQLNEAEQWVTKALRDSLAQQFAERFGGVSEQLQEQSLSTLIALEKASERITTKDELTSWLEDYAGR